MFLNQRGAEFSFSTPSAPLDLYIQTNQMSRIGPDNPSSECLDSRANLPQQSCKIEVNPAHRNLSRCEAVFVEGTARNMDLLTRRRDIRKGPFMLASKFHSTATRFAV